MRSAASCCARVWGSRNYWSACRARSEREFVSKLAVAVDEVEESVLWMTVVIRGGVRDDVEAKKLLREGEEIRAILSKSHKTARENRQRKLREKKKSKFTNSPTHQFTNST